MTISMFGHPISRRTALVGFLGGVGVLLAGGWVAKSASPSRWIATGSSSGVQSLSYTIRGHAAPGPDGQLHDSISPTLATVQAGRQVQLTVVNTDDAPHAMLFSGLLPAEGSSGIGPGWWMGPGGMMSGRNSGWAMQPGMKGFMLTIPGRSENTPTQVQVSFTPTQPGTYRWFCPLACDQDSGGWAMTFDSAGNGPSQDGFMAGYLNVAPA